MQTDTYVDHFPPPTPAAPKSYLDHFPPAGFAPQGMGQITPKSYVDHYPPTTWSPT
jgi:hypothetical protein